MNKSIYFSIISHNQTNLIKKNFVNFPKKVGSYDIKLVIVDNVGSKNLKKFCEQESILYYCDGIRRGFGANHNNIFHWLQPDDAAKFVVCNPDVFIEEEQLSKIIKNSERTDIYSPLVYFDKSSGQLDNPDKNFPGLLNFFISFISQKRLHYGTRVHVKQPEWISGAFMVFDINVYKILNGFDEDYFMYCEDIDICYRAHKMNITIILDDSCYIEHQAQMHSHHFLTKNNIWHMQSAFKFAFKHSKLYFLNNIKKRRKCIGGKRTNYKILDLPKR